MLRVGGEGLDAGSRERCFRPRGAHAPPVRSQRSCAEGVTVTDSGAVMREVERRVAKAEIESDCKRVAEIDAEIAKLQKRRDKLLQYIGKCMERLDRLGSAEKAP